MSVLAGRGRVVVALVVGVALTAGCRSAAHSAGTGESVRSPAASTSTAAAVLAFEPADRATDVRLDQQVSVRVSGGRLTEVTATRSGGSALAGALSGDGSAWVSDAALTPGASYTVVATSVDAAGRPATARSEFATLTPNATLRATIQPTDGQIVGVGMPVIVTFNRSIGDRAAVEQALDVTATPTVKGAWHWMSSREVQWRPEAFWPSGTKVSVTAGLAGVEGGSGLWGSKSTSSAFSIGRSMISTVDITRHTLVVRRNGVVIKTIPVTTGRAGPKTATRDGIKVIISRETSRRMDAATTGVDPKDPNYYNIVVRYAMRLTWSGEFLHAAPWSVASQGRANVSHGCTGMSTANARWLFDNSKVGDVVVYTHSRRPLEWGNGYTAWNMSWGTWAAPIS